MPPGVTSPFDHDVLLNQGYRYTTNASLSSQMANERLTRETLEQLSLRDRRVLDVGCGDGTYTAELARRGQPGEMVGIDAAGEAVKAARDRHGELPNVRFEVGDGGELAQFGRFDCAIVRGVLHHAEDPAKVLRAAGTISDELLVLEPNGYAPALKLIERVSRYHREHEERSFPPRRIRRWLHGAGLSVAGSRYVGLVPFFCPDSAAKALRHVEPIFEESPIAPLVCAVYSVRGVRQPN